MLGEVETAGDAKTPGFATFALPPHTRDVSLEVKSGPVRLFGWSFEKPGPGVIYNSLGLNGAQVQMALRYFEPKQWAAEMQHEDPDLVVINYGTNESVYPDYIERYYEKELRSLIERVRSAVPRASVLIMSPMDRGVRESGGPSSRRTFCPASWRYRARSQWTPAARFSILSMRWEGLEQWQSGMHNSRGWLARTSCILCRAVRPSWADCWIRRSAMGSTASRERMFRHEQMFPSPSAA